MARPNLQLQLAHSPVLRYGLAVASFGIALGLALLAQRYGFRNVEAPLFLFSVAITAWYAGPRPAAEQPAEQRDEADESQDSTDRESPAPADGLLDRNVAQCRDRRNARGVAGFVLIKVSTSPRATAARARST